MLKRIKYYTMNSWNRETAPAYNMKIYNLGYSQEVENRLYEMMYLPGFYDEINFLISDFEYENPGYSAGFNGRSGGYLVLYKKNSCKGFEASEVDSEVLKNFRRLALAIRAQAKYQAENGRIESVEVVTNKNIFVMEG